MIEHVHPTDRDIALHIRVREDNCPSMGVYPEAFYDEIENNILRGRGDFDVTVEHEVFEPIGPHSHDTYQERRVRVVHGRYAPAQSEA